METILVLTFDVVRLCLRVWLGVGCQLMQCHIELGARGIFFIPTAVRNAITVDTHQVRVSRIAHVYPDAKAHPVLPCDKPTCYEPSVPIGVSSSPS
jgi:hypothetical protein